MTTNEQNQALAKLCRVGTFGWLSHDFNAFTGICERCGQNRIPDVAGNDPEAEDRQKNIANLKAQREDEP